MTNCQDEICELYLKWIEIYGKKPRCSIAKNGVDLKLKEMTDEEKAFLQKIYEYISEEYMKESLILFGDRTKKDSGD